MTAGRFDYSVRVLRGDELLAESELSFNVRSRSCPRNGARRASRALNDTAMPNHLLGQTSPYLLQHLHNPVDWYPWSNEALSRARDEDKPIFLSIGYAACHWCHVMERESFENGGDRPISSIVTSSRSRSIARSGPTSTRST